MPNIWGTTPSSEVNNNLHLAQNGIKFIDINNEKYMISRSEAITCIKLDCTDLLMYNSITDELTYSSLSDDSTVQDSEDVCIFYLYNTGEKLLDQNNNECNPFGLSYTDCCTLLKEMLN